MHYDFCLSCLRKILPSDSSIEPNSCQCARGWTGEDCSRDEPKGCITNSEISVHIKKSSLKMFLFLFQKPTGAQYVMKIVLITIETQLEVMFVAVPMTIFATRLQLRKFPCKIGLICLKKELNLICVNS